MEISNLTVGLETSGDPLKVLESVVGDREVWTESPEVEGK